MMCRRTVAAGIALGVSSSFLLVAPFLFKPYGIFILSTWAVMTVAAIGLKSSAGGSATRHCASSTTTWPS
jgi:hypothetical protein